MGVKTLVIVAAGVLIILFTEVDKVDSNEEIKKFPVYPAAKNYYPSYYGNLGKNYYGKIARDGYAETPPAEISAPVGSYDTIGSSSAGGYGIPQQHAYQYKIFPTGSSYPNSYTTSNYVEEEYEESGGGQSGGGSEICIAALLGYKGAKGIKAAKALKAIKAIKAFKIFSPILLPIVLAPILPLLGLIFLPLLLIPILLFYPVIVAPTGRDGRFTNVTARILDNVLNSSQCVERLSCEFGQVAKAFNGGKYIQRLIGKDNTGWRGRIGRGFDSFGSCQNFSCSPLNFMRSQKETNISKKTQDSSMKPNTNVSFQRNQSK